VSVDAPAHVCTTRLDLRPADPDDTDALFPIFNDPAGWWFEPESRHLDIDTTRQFLVRAHDRWALHGLSYWTVRLADEQTVIGLGGTQRHRSGAWNLSYRIAGAQQGQGYARELATAGLAAAAAVDPTEAVIAWVTPHNQPSRRVAEHVGLVDRGMRIDANDGRSRLAFADRQLDPERFPFAEPAT
jgi:RimJ/RimL family protein N-acetyltransferase